LKNIILDSGPVISLAMNNLLWLLENVKEKYQINFFLTESVKRELVDNPLTTKRYKLEALQVIRIIEKGVLQVIDDQIIRDKANELLELANSSFIAQKQTLKIVHFAEMSVVAAAIIHKADAIMIDERTTRYLIERPLKLRNVLRHKLHTKIDMENEPLMRLIKLTENVKFIRSVEFVTVAFERGLLDNFLPKTSQPKKVLLEALLWGLKINGCAISTKDLETLLRIEIK
jgi:hypothetical protein